MRTIFAINSVELATEDLLTFARKDPAAHGSWQMILTSYRCYRCYRAILAHRVAHAVLSARKISVFQRHSDVTSELMIARKISEDAKVQTGVEIHPSAQIGPRFVLDHGIGSVIGETAVIGSDCYILQGVVLGSSGIAEHPEGKRHPTLGDRVEVGAFSRILGPITVQDDSVIGCHALVRNDVPRGGRVSVLHQYQVMTGKPIDASVTGIEALTDGRFRIHGHGLDRIQAYVDASDGATPGVAPITVERREWDHIVVQVPRATDLRPIKETHLRLDFPGNNATIALSLPRLGRRST